MMKTVKDVVGTDGDEYVNIAESSDLCQNGISISDCVAVNFVRTAIDELQCTSF